MYPSQRMFSKIWQGTTGRSLLFLLCLILTALACSEADLILEEDASPPVDPSLTDAEKLTRLAAELDGEIALVTWVVDGDTVEIELDGQERRVRYIGIDTPERDEDFYQAATEFNIELVKDKEVVLVRDVSDTDRFGRLLRYVYLADGTHVNEAIIAAGYAVSVTFPPDVTFVDTFRSLERQARADGLGLWGEE